MLGVQRFYCFFFFNDTATTEIYTLSLHDALPIWAEIEPMLMITPLCCATMCRPDRKSTRLNSSHVAISYAVFCLKKKKKNNSELTKYNIINKIERKEKNCKQNGNQHQTYCIGQLEKSNIDISEEVFFYNYTGSTEIYTLSLHDALPI